MQGADALVQVGSARVDDPDEGEAGGTGQGGGLGDPVTVDCGERPVPVGGVGPHHHHRAATQLHHGDTDPTRDAAAQGKERGVAGNRHRASDPHSGCGVTGTLGRAMAESATERFRALVHRPDSELRLDLGCLLIAAHGCPGLDVDAERDRLDDLAAAVPEATLAALVATLFGPGGLGFHGNHLAYADPRNSFLHEVMARRTGIPITLSIVAIEVGIRIGVPLVGIGMPGHFLIRHEAVPRVMVDPFEAGRLLDRDDCEARFRAIAGPGPPFHPGYLAPVGPRVILTRVLANLQQVYAAASNRDGLRWVLPLRAAIPGGEIPERLELAGGLESLGSYRDAATLLEEVADDLEGLGRGDPAEASRRHARLLRAGLN